jgi:orotidine-5'-phosphate decarboxylase
MSGAIEKYNVRVEKVNSLLCVGLDPNFEKLPEQFQKLEFPQFEFNKWIINQTAEYVAAYKPNTAFYESQGDKGMRELKMTMEYLQEHHPSIFTICDAKRADIAPTSQQYAKAIFDWFGFGAVTLNPYLGRDALQPFLDYKDRGCIIVARTSNPDAREFQDLLVEGKPVWQVVAETVVKDWNENKNCMLVAGATYPEEIKAIRRLVGDMTLLVPGVGAQGGDVRAAVQTGLNSRGKGLIISTGRSIIFAEDPGKATRDLRDEINRFRGEIL